MCVHLNQCLVICTWRAICHEDYKYNLLAQVNSCCILLKYSLVHVHRGTIGTRALTQNVPASIFRARSFACTHRGAKCE